MIRHFGVLIPSTNTTVEMECRLLPPSYQAHVGRLMTSAPGRTFSPSRDEDIDYQSRLLGTAKVELVILAQTSASLFADDYDEVVTRRMGAGAPAITSAQAMGRALRALRAQRIAIVSPYSDAVNDRAARYFETKHGLKTVALEGFGATDSYAIGQLGPENARNAFGKEVLEEFPDLSRLLEAGDQPTPASAFVSADFLDRLAASGWRGLDARGRPLSERFAGETGERQWASETVPWRRRTRQRPN